MKYPAKPEISNNFDTSILFYVERESQLDDIFLRKYQFLKRNGIEIILCLNKVIKKSEVLNRIKKRPFGNWKVFKYTNGSPSFKTTAFNLAVKHSKKKYILFIQNTVFDVSKDFLYELSYLIRNYEASFALASLRNNAPENCADLKYQCLILKRQDYIKAGGFYTFQSENIAYENLALRLQYLGIKKINYIVHGSEAPNYEYNRLMLRSKVDSMPFRNSVGRLTNVYDYSSSMSEEIAKTFLKLFIRHELCDSDLFQSKFNIVALIQTYNESTNILGVLSNIGNYCDGMILLDDSSTDNTFDLAKHSKLIMKAQKRRIEFNDLENRNILLDLASLVRSKWFVFIDADERLDSRFNSLMEIACDFESFDTIGFWFANLWDGEKSYLPISSGTDDKHGLWKRLRMFKNIGHSQIDASSPKLHFTCVPYIGKTVIANILVLHHGSIDATTRESKYQFYKSQDENWELNKDENYQFLLERKPVTRPVEGIQLPPPLVIR